MLCLFFADAMLPLCVDVSIIEGQGVYIDFGRFKMDNGSFRQLCSSAKVLYDYSIFLLLFIVLRRPIRPAALAPAKLRHAGAGAVHSAAGGLGEITQALAGGFQAHSAVGGVHPGCRLGEIPFLPPAHIAFSGTLHLVDLVPGVLLAVVLDVPGVQLFQLVAGPCRRVAQLRKHGEKGVTAVPAAQPGTPKSGCMTLPEICTDNSGKIQKRR